MTNTENNNTDSNGNRIINLLSSYTQTNNDLLKILGEIPKEDKETRDSLVELIQNNTKISKQLLNMNKDNFIWALPDPEKEKNDKFASFKSLMVVPRILSDTSIYMKSKTPSWYNMGRAVGLTVNKANSFLSKVEGDNLFEKTKNILLKPVEGVKYIYQEFESKKDTAYAKILFIGEKRVAKKIKNEFAQELSLLGFSTSDILHNSKSINFLSEQEIANNINESLNKKYSVSLDGDFVKINLIDKLSDDMKKEFLDKILWDKIKKEISAYIGITNYINEMKEQNIYMKKLIDFSNTNDIKPDVVMHMLSEKPELLADKKGYSKIISIRENILETKDKYEKIIKSSVQLLSNLVNVTENIKQTVANLNIDEESKKSFIEKVDGDSVFLNKKTKKIFTYEHIKRNLANIRTKMLDVTPSEEDLQPALANKMK